jgi:16S rRNA (guanine527-N7)-methyltransferase
MISKEEKTILENGLQELGLHLDSAGLDKLCLFHQQLLAWNKRINLISRKDEDRLIQRHLLDSLTVFQVVSFPEGARLLDVGSGGGLPGIPIKIAQSDLKVDLLESTKKKCRFLQQVLKELGLEMVPVISTRAEDLAIEEMYRNYYDFVTARGVAKPEKIEELALPLLKSGGKLIIYADPQAEGEKRFKIIEKETG